MPKTRRLLTNFSKGELSPRIEGRPDLAAYFEGANTIENFRLMRQGGLDRRPGTRFVAEVKDNAKDTIIVRFEFSVAQAFAIEFGELYIRFYKNGAQIMSGGLPFEIASPYLEAELRDLHFTQSADIIFIFHENHLQRKLSRVSDTNWTLASFDANPPPSFESDVDISGGGTLTPGATTGLGVTFTASVAAFLAADVGRQIIFGASKANIVGFTSSTVVTADIIDDFPDTNPIPSGSWFLRLSPQTALTPTIKEPIGAQVTLTAAANAFSTSDVGKFITIFGGLVEITQRTSATVIVGIIRTVLVDAATPIVAAPAGSWTLEVNSWSAARGFPRTGEFHQGRLAQAASLAEPTTWWLSASDDFENYGVGSLADNALEYTIAAPQVNRIEWLADNIDLFLGTAGSEFRAKGPSIDQPIGGDVLPLVVRQTTEGCSHIQPIVIGRQIIFVDRSFTQILQLGFSLEADTFIASEITDIAEQITGSGIRLGGIGQQKRPDPIIYFVRQDGELVVLTYFLSQKVVGFTRYVTDGTFESVAVLPPRGTTVEDEVWVIVKRTINGATKRYVEFFDHTPSEFLTRPWVTLQTDSAFIFDGAATTTITGLTHLEGETVDVVADDAFRGTKVVASGQITLDEAASKVEIGLHYNSKLVTMRPAVQGEVLEGLPRSWDKLFVRLLETIGGTVNGEQLKYVPDPLDTKTLFVGDKEVTGLGWDTVGRITVEQLQPYPMKLLAVFGTLSIGDTD